MKKNRVGEIGYNKFGSKMVIEEYKDYYNVLVRFFDSQYLTNVQYGQFKNGKVRNPYDKSVFGVGYLGEGNYRAKVNRKHTKQYSVWRNMLNRVCDDKYHEKHPTYKECSVIGEWLNFQNFASWFDENYYEIEGEIMHLDKDILIKGNKTYSSDTCVFVPNFINQLFVKRDSLRGSLPIGVIWNKRDEVFHAQCTDNNKQINLGSFDNPEDAFLTYKTYKEKVIKKIAGEYKEQLPDNLYNAMISYKVEIDD